MNTIKEYRTIVLDASVQLYNTRFDAFWNAKEINPLSDTVQDKNDQSGTSLQGEMVPIDFEKLKKDQEYLYFLESLKNRHYYLMEDMVDNQTANIKALISEIDAELVLLKNR